MHRWKGVPHLGTTARHEGKCSSTRVKESTLCGKTARIPRVAALWAQEGEGRGLSSSGMGECSQPPDHVEDDMLLTQIAKLALR